MLTLCFVLHAVVASNVFWPEVQLRTVEAFRQQPSAQSRLLSTAANAAALRSLAAVKPPRDNLEVPVDACGLGLDVEMRNGSLIVTRLAPGGSAAESGLVSVDDVIVKVFP